MTLFRPAAVVLLACLACPVSVLAAAPEAQAIEAGVNWTLAFGASQVRTGYDLHLGYRPDDSSPLAMPVARLSVDDTSSLATIAGLPVAAHAWAARQSAGDAAYDTGLEAPKPWYEQSWFYWTLGGVAVSAMLATAGSSSGDQHSCAPGGTCNQDCTGNTLSTCNGSFCVQDDQNCVPTSVGTGGYAERRAGASGERPTEEEIVDVHGGMGDLAEAAP